MSKDTIYRQAAVEALEAKKDKSAKGDIGCFHNAIIQNDIDTLKGLPSAEPRPKGRWIDYTDDGYVECPFCGSATNCDDNISELHYCFSCGADMREEEQDATD